METAAKVIMLTNRELTYLKIIRSKKEQKIFLDQYYAQKHIPLSNLPLKMIKEIGKKSALKIAKQKLKNFHLMMDLDRIPETVETLSNLKTKPLSVLIPPLKVSKKHLAEKWKLSVQQLLESQTNTKSPIVQYSHEVSHEVKCWSDIVTLDGEILNQRLVEKIPPCTMKKIKDAAEIFLGKPTEVEEPSLKITDFRKAIHHEIRLEPSRQEEYRLLGGKFYLAHGDILISSFYRDGVSQHPMTIVNIGKKDLCKPAEEIKLRDIHTISANGNVTVIRPRQGVRPWILFLMLRNLLQNKIEAIKANKPTSLNRTYQKRVLIPDLYEMDLPANPKTLPKKAQPDKRLALINKMEKIRNELDQLDTLS